MHLVTNVAKKVQFVSDQKKMVIPLKGSIEQNNWVDI